jgi:hypothetical protein
MRRSASSRGKWWVVGETHKELALRVVLHRAFPGCSVQRVTRCEAVVLAHRQLVKELLWLMPFDGSQRQAEGALHYKALLQAIDALLSMLQATKARAVMDEVLNEQST